MLAAVDEAHETLSGPATRKILHREWHEFQDARYERLAELSVAQLYRLRKSRVYRQRRIAYQPTRPTQVSIGERRKPDPKNRAGYLRVDTVHQGDLGGVKGIYHINAVDEVTQWQIVGATAQVSEARLMPVLEAMLEQFPFFIRGFHSDNGSEFINRKVAHLLNKMLVEQTKSRPRHPQQRQRPCRNKEWLGNPQTHRLRSYRTGTCRSLRPVLPRTFQPLSQLSQAMRSAGNPGDGERQTETCIPLVRDATGYPAAVAQRCGRAQTAVTIDGLDQVARARSDTQAATEMQREKRNLFERLQKPRKT